MTKPQSPSSPPEAQPRDEPRHSPSGNGGPSLLTTRYSLLLSYFRSGWAFLIPYLAAYLLYAWLRWPVNPVAGGQLTVVPCLLHVYWFLHAVHLVLGMIAMRSWWRSEREEQGTLQPSSELTRNAEQVTGNRLLSTVYRLLPWLCLTLLIWIPGVYLEFPSDPWQHYGRVNEWSWLQSVTEHSAWKKSSYFFGYSLIGHVSPPILQLKWFDVYYTGCCMLLCWQYFRLARAVGLGERASFVFVLLNTLTFGNNVFGFYRYYGMSSSLFAQLGAVALTRLAIEAARGSLRRQGYQAQGMEKGLKDNGGQPFSTLFTTPRTLLLQGASAFALVALTAFNHVQGLGIAGLGIAAIVVWRLIDWRRSMIWWLILVTAILSVITVQWYPRHPALDQVYLPQGWLTQWYGFNLFHFSSPAFDRTVVILGFLGFINLAAGVLLLWRNQAVGWLTVLPVVALCLPFVAVPFANALAADASFEGGYIIAFHRIIFAVPAGLAIVVLITHWAPLSIAGEAFRPNTGLMPVNHSAFPIGLLLFSLLALVTLPAHGRYFNRLYNILMVPPDDLAMRHVTQLPALNRLTSSPTFNTSLDRLEEMLLERGNLLTTPGIGYVLNATGQTFVTGARKWMIWPNTTPPSQTASAALAGLKNIASQRVHNTPFGVTDSLYTPGSITGPVSQHWLAYAVALEHAAQAELFKRPVVTGSNLRAPQLWLEWSDAKAATQYFAFGAEESLISTLSQDRGRLDAGAENQRIKAGDRLVFRPVIRAPDGNGLRVAVTIQGPEFHSHRTFTGRPSPLGGENWIFGDHVIQLKQPGEYTVDIAGTTLWPPQTFTVRYHLVVQPDNR